MPKMHTKIPSSRDRTEPLSSYRERSRIRPPPAAGLFCSWCRGWESVEWRGGGRGETRTVRKCRSPLLHLLIYNLPPPRTDVTVVQSEAPFYNIHPFIPPPRSQSLERSHLGDSQVRGGGGAHSSRESLWEARSQLGIYIYSTIFFIY